jgi:hypothetical protein
MPQARVEFGGEALVSLTASNDGENPNEFFLDDMELDSLYMFNRDWSEKELRVCFGDMGTDALLSLIFGIVEEWEE